MENPKRHTHNQNTTLINVGRKPLTTVKYKTCNKEQITSQMRCKK